MISTMGRVALRRSKYLKNNCNFSSKGSGSTTTTTKAQVPKRKIVSPAEREALRAARRDQGTQALAQAQAGSGISTAAAAASKTTGKSSTPVDPRLFWGLGLGVPTILLGWGIADEDSPPANFARMIRLTDVIDNAALDFKKPSRESLLPDWGMMPNVPKNMEPPHTLVLDLENTLVNSTWDRKHGWRFAKRPGVDKFLSEMAQYYEIVIYSPSHEGVAEPVITLLDPKGFIMHRLYRDACFYDKGIYMKDLSSLNRNLNKIILLDDDENSASLNPGHLVRVKPYDDPKDRQDNTLERITPFLIEIAKEGHNNIPQTLDQFRHADGTRMDADEIANDHERRVMDMRSNKMRRAKRGLGSFSGMSTMELPAPEMTAVSARAKGQRSSGAVAPTAKDLVGAAPADAQTASNSKGIAGWLQRRSQEQQEEQMRKNEYWT